MAKMYGITGDILALSRLVENLVDEEGNSREPTEGEKQAILEWVGESETSFYAKGDSICKLAKNLQMEAAVAEAERKAHADEMARLSRTAKARENRAKAVRMILYEALERLHTQKYRSALFSASIQATAKVPGMAPGAAVPERFAKPRELDGGKVREALESGALAERDGRLHTPDGADTGITYLGGKTLVIR